MSRRFWLAIGLLLVVLLGGWVLSRLNRSADPLLFEPGEFSAARAFADLETQVSFGPRIVGFAGYDEFHAWIDRSFQEAGWGVALHETDFNGVGVKNIIASRGDFDPNREWVIIGTHYDTRLYADRDPLPGNRELPVPGANDGASGVAVLLELARVLPELEDKHVWFVLFDGEDNGDIDGKPWIIGSSAFVSELHTVAPGRLPDAVVIIDMIGDRDLNIHLEQNSDPELSAILWDKAASLGYGEAFIPTVKYSMIDDHRPFLNAGIPVSLLIDFDYSYWHTIEDIPENTSGESLKIVGDTLLSWLSD